MDEIALQQKTEFADSLTHFVQSLNTQVTTEDGQWTVKGFIDVFRNVYTITSDTKIVSKILEIHLFPKLLEMAEMNNYRVVLADHQNYYPDLSFVSAGDSQVKFAVDFKTTYRLPEYPDFCNGFTLGSHGEYFINRNSTKNIQFPYNTYLGHYCLGIIYSRADKTLFDETKIYDIGKLQSITSVIKDLQFFVVEKWRIASDRRGSGNTANIGSIDKISDVVAGRGMFSLLGEVWFDDYWMNYGKITITDEDGGTRKLTRLSDFVRYKKGDPSLIVSRARKKRKRNIE